MHNIGLRIKADTLYLASLRFIIWIIVPLIGFTQSLAAQELCVIRGTAPICGGECKSGEVTAEKVDDGCWFGTKKVKCCDNRVLVRLKNKSTSRCLNVHGGDNREGGSASVFSCAETHDQEWFVVIGFPDRRWLKLVNRSSGKCLNIHGGDNVEGGHVSIYTCADTPDQQWERLLVGDSVKFKHRATGRCLNVHRGNHNFDRAPVTSYTCATSPDQEWIQEIRYTPPDRLRPPMPPPTPRFSTIGCRWDGTAIFCSGSCPANMVEVARRRSLVHGGIGTNIPNVETVNSFGDSCVFGTKALCCPRL